MSWATLTTFWKERRNAVDAANRARRQSDVIRAHRRFRAVDTSRRCRRSNTPCDHRPTAYKRKLSSDHGTGLSVLSVCVTRTNLARTGLNVATVVAGDPFPSATGAPQVLPSIDTCTR